MAYIDDKGKVIIVIPNLDTYQGIKSSLFEMLFQAGFGKDAKDLEIDGEHLTFFSDLLKVMELEIEKKENTFTVKRERSNDEN